MSRQGHTLTELLIAVAILALLATQGVPAYRVASEEGRVDKACAALRTVWLGQRMYWLEKDVYASSLEELSSLRLVESTLPDRDEPFHFTIQSADAAGFVAQAERRGSSAWSGSLRIDETGQLSGWTRDRGGRHVSPPVD